jgi:hypothetical protein
LVNKEIEFPQASFMAYASFVGLEVQSENNNEGGYQDTVGIFHFRLLGVADQSTHLTLNFGQKSRKFKNVIGESLRKQSFGEVDLAIYFNDYFGIQGLYRNYAPIEKDINWGSVTGSQNELGGFIDYEFLRVFINYFKEVEVRTLNLNKSNYSLEGYKSGIKLYF